MTSPFSTRPLFIALGLLLVLVLWLSLALGPVSLPLGDTLRAALRLLGLPLTADASLPRISHEAGRRGR